VSTLTRSALLAAVAALTCASVARADGTTDACIANHANGQVLRKQGHLVAAHDHFLACAVEDCPAMVRSECAAFASDVEAAIPSVVFAAVSAKGEDVDGATVTVDGQPALALDGRAVDIDPGPHRFDFTAPGTEPRTVSLVLREAERLRRVGVVLEPEPDPKKDGLLSVHPMVYVLGGIGMAATASFAVFALKGRSQEHYLTGNCAPGCERADVDTMRRDYLIGDISLGVALVSFSVGTYFLLRPPDDQSDESAPAPRTARLHVDWAPAVAPGLAVMTARGTF
jgi:hypothetical protein